VHVGGCSLLSVVSLYVGGSYGIRCLLVAGWCANNDWYGGSVSARRRVPIACRRARWRSSSYRGGSEFEGGCLLAVGGHVGAPASGGGVLLN
jgi:hypothetical protein